ncbi:helix-turn-helix transcriptional regulator [Aureibaculum sp. 2210JD6-5]|uniref:helix-turn-helix domain-containing protein n=1 Tax=Aureibaculum sp. 2210JD6-5 TaxID=3103957 RepID=UPI002AACB616|nr:helix-turn-helix transcriptional regulator [Aureibaculum sp. 2210JD6-5]MDY7394033.1 helix-turn-helix transcriptional regulator [Aureibaculum sp. 2210JD6-5]
MINTLDFSKRLQLVMDYYQLSAAAFADKIEVQRSSISHLLSGRNKPSLDFVLKVLDKFKEVELYWLLNGKGTFPTQEHLNSSTIQKASDISTSKQHKEIDRIIIFYKDGSFKDYNQDVL